MNKLRASSIYLFEAFTYGLAMRLVFTTYIIYRVDVLHLDALQLVLLGTVLEVTIFLFEIPTGVVADLYSRRLSSIIGFALLGVAILMEGIIPTFIAVLLAQIVSGLGHTFLSGAYEAWITDEVGVDKVGPLFLRAGQLDKLGALLAIPLAVFFARAGLALPYLIGGGLFMLLAAFLVLFMPETGFTRASKQDRQDWAGMWKQFTLGLDLVRGRRVLIIFSVIAVFVGLYSEAWDRLAQPHLLETFVFPSVPGLELDTIAWFGIFGAANMVLGIIANGLANRLVDSTRSAPLLRALQAIYLGMTLSILAFALTGSFYAALAFMLVFNMLRSLSFPLSAAWINMHINSKLRATVLSMVGQLDAFGELSGGPFLGLIGKLRSIRAALITSALILAPVSFLYRRIGLVSASDNEEQGS